MDSLIQEQRIISTFQIFIFWCKFKFALSKHLYAFYIMIKNYIHFTIDTNGTCIQVYFILENITLILPVHLICTLAESAV